jgi:hypothetical protein
VRPAAQVLILSAGSVAGAAIGLVVANWLDWGNSVLPVAVATAVCLSSGIATLVLADVVFRNLPQFGPVAVLVGTGLRMTVAVVGVFLFADVMERHGTPRDRFAGWVTYLYIVTLALECGLLMGTAAGRRAGETPATTADWPSPARP